VSYPNPFFENNFMSIRGHLPLMENGGMMDSWFLDVMIGGLIMNYQEMWMEKMKCILFSHRYL
jgi:hypothetical protein